MAVTLTRVSGPHLIAPRLKLCIYAVALDAAHAAGGEVIDVSGEFDYIYYAACGANDTAADNYQKYDIIHPGYGTAVTAANVKITACWSDNNASGEPFKAITGDLSAVGDLQILIIGR